MKCKSCTKKLTRMDWNTKVDILVCLNEKCRLCQRPQGAVKLNKHSLSGENLIYWSSTPQGIDSLALSLSRVAVTDSTGKTRYLRKRPPKVRNYAQENGELPELAIGNPNAAQSRDPWFRD